MGKIMYSHDHKNRKKYIPLMILGGIAFVAAFTLAVMLLWNWLMPVIFGLIEINFWQALGILVLSKILLCGFHHKSNRTHKSKDYWKKRFDEEEKFSGETQGAESTTE